ncbi:MAG: VanZ family protein [Armatimonadetes bacterium]|nr:VanZ family protein [Armatimonadota bacterium]
MRPKAFLWPALWVAVIFVTSSTLVTSRQFVKSVATTVPVGITEDNFGAFWRATWFIFVKGYHVLEYLVLFLLFHAAFRGLTAPKWETRLTTVLLTLTFAALDEFHQQFVPGRGGHLSDVAIDALGVLLGMALVEWRARQAS